MLMEFSLQELSKILQARYQGNAEHFNFQEISIDSRNIIHGSKVLFFALKGLHHNAHLFVDELIARGVRCFVVENSFIPKNTSVDYFFVEDTLNALQKFATVHREQFSIPVLGITGSSGKTIVKEWLNFLLSPSFNIVKSPKSYNSQVGVPLSVLSIQKENTLAIFEAGISQMQEMQALEEIIKPTIGIFTSLNQAHQEGFVSQEDKLKEKFHLFKNTQILICPEEFVCSELLSNQICIWDWSFAHQFSGAKVQFRQLEPTILNVTVSNETSFDVNLPFQDANSLENIATCIVTLLALNISIELIQQKIPLLYPVEMRLQVLKAKQQCTLINDSFNADYTSLKIALDFMEQQKTSNQGKILILSDLFESGNKAETLYQKVKYLLEAHQLNQVIGIGTSINKHLKSLNRFVGFEDTLSFLNHYNLSSFKNQTILIKGARGFSFDKIVSELEEKTHETILEINLDAISHNLHFYQSKLCKTTKTMAMVKAFGYGNGSYEIAKRLAHDKVDYLGVAFADEGIELRKAGITLPIVVMNPEKSAFSSMIAYNLEPEIFSLNILESFLKEAKNHNLYKYPIHLKLNTGMNRLGFIRSDFNALINVLNSGNWLWVSSIFSHLSCSDLACEREFTLNQLECFSSWVTELKLKLKINPLVHILNTSGIFNFPEYQFSMVRLGIGLYGQANSEQESSQLENVATLKTKILQIHQLTENQSIGYGRGFKTVKSSRIATLPVGYADGIRRTYGNGLGKVYINGKLVSIVGNICMDMLMVDVSECQVQEGDEAIIFGKEFSVGEVAKLWETIPYEVMTSISRRVKRIFYSQ